jgi:hypothetical protein
MKENSMSKWIVVDAFIKTDKERLIIIWEKKTLRDRFRILLTGKLHDFRKTFRKLFSNKNNNEENQTEE